MIDYSKKPTQKRALKVLNWIELRMKSNFVVPLSRTELYDVFGNTSRTPGKELKQLVLEVADPWYNMNGGICIKYRKRPDGIQEIKQGLGLDSKWQPQLNTRLQQEIESGAFEYTEKSNRLFHPAQFIPKQFRNQELYKKGYRWSYDIEACAPTLLYQYAQRLYQQQWLELSSLKKARRPHILTLPLIEEYILNRSVVRQRVARACEISEENTKLVINALFQGSRLSAWPHSKLFLDLNQDYDAVKKLQHNQDIINLLRELRDLWSIIKETLPVRYLTSVCGKQVRQRVSGKEKSQVYLKLERQICEILRGELVTMTNRHLWMHDGWYCTRVVDSDRLCEIVKQKTSYLIKLEQRAITE